MARSTMPPGRWSGFGRFVALLTFILVVVVGALVAAAQWGTAEPAVQLEPVQVDGFDEAEFYFIEAPRPRGGEFECLVAVGKAGGIEAMECESRQ